MKFCFGVFKSHFIRTIDNPNDAISLFKIISPIRPDSFLSPDIPDIEFKVFILQGFNIEAQSGTDFVDVLSIEFLDNCCFASIVKA